MEKEPPESIVGNPRLMEIWKRSHHILSVKAFEPDLARVVLLPILSKYIKADAGRLLENILRTPGQNITALSEVCKIPYGRCRSILWFRDKVEWKVVKDAGLVLSYPLNDDRIARLIPQENQITIEYLVAELERVGFDLAVESWPGKEERMTIRSCPGAPNWFPGLGAWLVEFHKEMKRYIKKRDGLSPPHYTSRDSR